MQESAEIGLINDSIFDGRRRDGPTDLVVVPDHAGLRDVAAFGPVDAVHVADAFAVFRVLAVGEVNEIFVNDRRADDFVTRLGPDGVFRISVKLPKLLAGRCFIAAHPAVALAVYDLVHATDRSDGGRTPLAVQDTFLDRIVFPNELAGLLVDGDDR